MSNYRSPNPLFFPLTFFKIMSMYMCFSLRSCIRHLWQIVTLLHFKTFFYLRTHTISQQVFILLESYQCGAQKYEALLYLNVYFLFVCLIIRKTRFQISDVWNKKSSKLLPNLFYLQMAHWGPISATINFRKQVLK